MGVITKGDSFELAAPTLAVIGVTASCEAARDISLQTDLTYLSAGGRTVIISRTDVTSSTRRQVNNGAALYLPAGKYSYVARIRANPGGEFVDPNIDSATVTLYPDTVYPDYAGRAVASGSTGGFVTVSVRKELPVMGRARISASLPDGDRLTAAVRLTDLSNNQSFSSPRALLWGPNVVPLQLDADSVVLQPGRMYRFEYDLIYGGEAELTSSISVG